MKKLMTTLLLAAIAVTSLAAIGITFAAARLPYVDPARPTPDPTNPAPAPEATHRTFVIVHGAWQAPFAWRTVQKQLEAKGHKVIVVELPGHGEDQTAPAACSIDAYRDKVIADMKDLPGKVVLVGHSMAGMVISEVAEKIPARIEKLVYLAAYVPANGQSLMDFAALDKQSILGPSLIPSKDQLTLDVKQADIISIFCQDAPVAAQKLVLKHYRAEPAIPFGNKVTVTEANWGSVDKYYIHTEMDHAIGIELQNQMVSTAHITKVYSLNTGHSPFLSQPGELTTLLRSITQ